MNRGRAVAQTLLWLLFVAALLFGSAGRLRWPAAWVLVAGFGLFSLAGFAVLSPDLIRERSRLDPGATAADRWISVPALFFLYPATFVVCGLELRFTGSARVPALAQGIGLGVFAAGYAVSLWAAASNPFFSTVVRIQTERGHRVIDRGPYAFVRHPGYAGPLIGHLALPIGLGSPWGLAPAVLGFAFLALRTVYEERQLALGLPGYADYMRRVRWRLFPGLW